MKLPTRAEIEAAFRGVIEGTRTREDVEAWAGGWASVEIPHNATQEAIDSLCLVACRHGAPPAPYMYPVDQVAEWLSEYSEACDAEYPRGLTGEERAIVDHVLSARGPGMAELREQAQHVKVVGKCHCGCPTIDLEVDRTATPPTQLSRRPAVDCFSVDREDPDKVFDLLVWVEDGWLTGIELAYYNSDPPAVFPPPSDFGAPTCNVPKSGIIGGWEFGWVDASIPAWVDANREALTDEYRIVLSTLDSGREVSASPMLAKILGRGPIQPGGAVSMSADEFVRAAESVFFGFEEVWICRAGAGVQFSDAPQRLDCSEAPVEPTGEMVQWLERGGVIVGLGDGLGLAYVASLEVRATGFTFDVVP